MASEIRNNVSRSGIALPAVCPDENADAPERASATSLIAYADYCDRDVTNHTTALAIRSALAAANPIAAKCGRDVKEARSLHIPYARCDRVYAARLAAVLADPGATPDDIQRATIAATKAAKMHATLDTRLRDIEARADHIVATEQNFL